MKLNITILQRKLRRRWWNYCIYQLKWRLYVTRSAAKAAEAAKVDAESRSKGTDTLDLQQQDDEEAVQQQEDEEVFDNTGDDKSR
ncbi:hypothetical protein N7454_000195 [Penicillium verhagenii]|nr:hypothetical protein N7454_000195 [Penicillium verhagenii]